MSAQLASNVLTMVTAGFLIGTVATWLAYASSQAEEAMDAKDLYDGTVHRLSRRVPITVSACLAVSALALVTVQAFV